jgi:hypothetical protein
MRSTARITSAIGRSRKAMLVVGSAAALVGVGSAAASAATVGPHSHVPAAVVSQHHVASRSARSGSGRSRRLTWGAVEEIQAHDTDAAVTGGHLPAADQLTPVAYYGAQQDMQITPAQYGNAATIVHQALAKRMGVRSAVIAVATAMQESELNNINYGTSDSLGLFQQQSDCGWGTAQQIMDPAYASDAFLTALQKYQASNPDWASQPLWQSAQGVQASGFPTAYAQWEAQAAGLVQSITTQLTR